MLFVEIVAGLVLLLLGGDALVRGAVAAATRLSVSPLVIGLTIVGFGTSTPELVTSLEAAFIGSSGVAIGNVVGSNTANILLILGAAAALSPISVERASLVRDGGVATLGAIACVGVVLSGTLDRLSGVALLLGLVAYISFTVFQERRTTPSANASEDAGAAEISAPRATLYLLGGLAAIVAGATLLVSASVELARALGVSEAVIGVSLVAVGTSLPELVASVAAAFRGHADVAFGNVLGSNIYNVFGILGATAIVHPIPVPAQIAAFDIWVMLAAAIALLVVAISGWRITRLEGIGLLLGYAAYLSILALG